MEKQFFTAPEVARMAKITPQSVREFCRTGKIQAQKIGRDWIISINAVRRFLNDRGIVNIDFED